MIDWRPCAVELATELTQAGVLASDWRQAFERVPRHPFVPEFFTAADERISGDDPAQHDRWLAAVYSDASLTTQIMADLSWVEIGPDTDNGSTVSFGGPRLLWPDIADTWHRWNDLGRPESSQFRLTAYDDGHQCVWLDGEDLLVPRYPDPIPHR